VTKRRESWKVRQPKSTPEPQTQNIEIQKSIKDVKNGTISLNFITPQSISFYL
jgi:hypothetical protein